MPPSRPGERDPGARDLDERDTGIRDPGTHGIGTRDVQAPHARGRIGVRRAPQAAILGGVGSLATEALIWMLAESGSRVVGAYANPRALSTDLGTAAGDVQVVLIDAEDPESGIPCVPEVRRAQPCTKILLLCEALTPAIVRCAIEEHVEGVVLKSDSVEDVLVAYRHIVDGRAVMPVGWQSVPIEPQVEAPIELLSVREREVLMLVADGMHNREIAERLTISSNTVKFHLRTIYSRLGVRNRVQAMNMLATSGDLSKVDGEPGMDKFPEVAGSSQGPGSES